MSKILILTHERDDCADMVIKHFIDYGEKYVRFNTECFQDTVKLTLKSEKDGYESIFHFPEGDLYSEEISVVWNRRVHDPKILKLLSYDPEIIDWIKEECAGALNCVFSVINCPVVNPWLSNEKTRSNKFIQMQKAKSLGLKTPKSCITNKIDNINSFWEEVNQNMIIKKIRKGLFFFKNEKLLVMHTTQIPKEWFSQKNIERMSLCPVFMQENISKKYDIRSVVIGNNIISVAIHSQDIKQAKSDYRSAFMTGQLDNMKHEIIDLGFEVNKLLIKYTRFFGLYFNTIDLIETLDGSIVFLEHNANGQWGWLERKTGFPISKKFFEYLINLKSIY